MTALKTQTPPTPSTRAPRRRVIGSFPTYADAARIVRRLSERRFPTGRSTIIARELSFVRSAAGMRRAALLGALRGAVAGALLGLLLGAVAYVAIAGAIAGALAGVALHDSDSAARMEADAYDVLVDDQIADDATEALVAAERAS